MKWIILVACLGVNVPFVIWKIGFWEINLFAIGFISCLIFLSIIERI